MIGRPFKKGQSGNPGGRPKVVAEIRQLARERGPEAIAALVKVMTKGKSEAARVAAANALRTPASLEQRGMAKDVRSDHRANRGIAYIWSRLGEVVRGNERTLWQAERLADSIRHTMHPVQDRWRVGVLPHLVWPYHLIDQLLHRHHNEVEVAVEVAIYWFCAGFHAAERSRLGVKSNTTAIG